MSSKGKTRIASSLQELPAIRFFVRLHCGQLTLDEESTLQLELAVHEIASNIIKHAYQQRPGHPVEVEFIAADSLVAVRLFHWGEPLTPDRLEPPAFDGSREHGFGLYIVAQCVDQVTYSTAAGGRSCIELIKHCTPLTRRIHR